MEVRLKTDATTILNTIRGLENEINRMKGAMELLDGLSKEIYFDEVERIKEVIKQLRRGVYID